MPKLKCDAKKCIYNCEKYCVKSVIHVNDDLDAKKCVSFSEQKYESGKFDTEFAQMDGVNKYVSIECEAKACDHNANGMCVSENVQIGCDKDMCTHNTVCKTFSL